MNGGNSFPRLPAREIAMPVMRPSSAEPGAICVSIRAVSAHQFELCQRLRQAIDAVADIPVSLLVVPDRLPNAAPVRRFETWLASRLADGDELALQAWVESGRHQEGRWLRRMVGWMRSDISTRLSNLTQARNRLIEGIDWFAGRRWPLYGLAAPAWLMSERAWRTVADYPFHYLLTRRRFLLLPHRRAIPAQSATCTASRLHDARHSSAGPIMVGAAWRQAALVRLCLRPEDAGNAETLRRCQQWVATLLKEREAMTVADYAALWRRRSFSRALSTAQV